MAGQNLQGRAAANQAGTTVRLGWCHLLLGIMQLSLGRTTYLLAWALRAQSRTDMNLAAGADPRTWRP